jgi:hypothetical protein
MACKAGREELSSIRRRLYVAEAPDVLWISGLEALAEYRSEAKFIRFPK